jgi:aldose 1-epimerase
MKSRLPFRPLVLTALLAACAAPLFAGEASRVEKVPFGRADGKQVDLYVLRDASGMTAKVMTYGATLVELDTPDDVVLGFPTLAGYLQKEPYFGATVGRVANRIGHARFTLDGKVYHLAANDGRNTLHGGIHGFDKVVWDAQDVTGSGPEPSVRFTYLSKDGEEHFPGNCRVIVTFTIAGGDSLRIDYSVTTDKDTPVNVTNHSYFNLGGPEKGNILGHVVTIDAARYTVVNSELIPTGELRPVRGTPMDFTSPNRVGARIRQITGNPVGYDHNYVVDGFPGKLRPVATVYDPESGRVMDVSSTEPGVQFYTGNFLDGSLVGKKGVRYGQYWGLALETQHFPDAMNQSNFISDVLKAGQLYRSTTVYKFTTRPAGR